MLLGYGVPFAHHTEKCRLLLMEKVGNIENE
jgi:hypothetical protein